ncbi:acyl-CoA dehydrogenase family protein [Achromobacter seleniivolatilans]|uniref:Acyl-CoA dehydrogenase family protein n=1 Tax=Achromobacter seleniivolatilans TaxID=3047478 RepID=A0ABY9M399_9BURK|nr:acyl-CoA dehydrogenase family protein [Achromobacter sp. R39]WMD21486.1 acyl-CoA dehydrogenase family protein [Achromobacter sp. R39]
MTAPYVPVSERNLFGYDFGPRQQAVDALAATLAATAIARDKQGGTALAERQAIRDSGLLTLRVPGPDGRPAESLPAVLRIVRHLASADSSLAHLFAFQHLQVETLTLFGTPAQQRRFHEHTAAGWFWGNATNDRDTRLRLLYENGRYFLDGERMFCSGSADSDGLIINVAHPAQAEGRIFLAVPTKRHGIEVLHDWDAIGQRQTDSGTVRFDRVKVENDELLGWEPGQPAAARLPRHTLRACLAQLILAEIYLGNTEGALAQGLDYIGQRRRPWPSLGEKAVLEDSLLQLRFGEYWTRYRGARALTQDAALALQAAWDRGDALTADERGQLALEIAQARLSAADAGLHIASNIFDQAGASATLSSTGLDRYWRNIRVHSLHDPLDHKRVALGNWLLNGQFPVPSGYS